MNKWTELLRKYRVLDGLRLGIFKQVGLSTQDFALCWCITPFQGKEDELIIAR
jgi:hypothetical protein